MSVDVNITRQILQEEVDKMATLAAAYGWEVATNLTQLTVTVTMQSSLNQEKYVVEAKCDDYQEMPPYFEFIHPAIEERGTKRCYPSRDGSSFFHPQPCICVQWNRKAYNTHGGPHSDWTMSNWSSYRPNIKTLGDMFNAIQTELDRCPKRMEK